jgi:hypothetical protein
MQIELQLTKIGAVERISLKAHGLRSVANSNASPTVAYASGSVFRVFPWLILLLRQPSLTLPALFSVSFRVIPWLILLLLPFSVANSSASPTVAYASGSDFRVFPCHSVAKMSFLRLLFSGSASSAHISIKKPARRVGPGWLKIFNKDFNHKAIKQGLSLAELLFPGVVKLREAHFKHLRQQQ